ncbi:class I SAM-dependent methyltransferase [Pengzhenrongella frigida]|uniref:Class I SAM-dependent methyltransferase n=1 Tax=Pengzhenrongella frigida TaxID=1259133 RepID=A0A4Q5N1P1_9MICO|nr:class I SAM-dependent methyltransferase [Cellulomonas sp. HLT2-17]RYV51193.1 class I SAM-dependent methyltransferase [Cellulomonas sp. HLT2-17]
MPHHDAHAHHGTGHDHDAHSQDLPELLDLDAQVLGAYLPAVTAWTAEHATDVRTVLDLGAGTGVGSVALAQRFPEAQVVALERSPVMIDHLTATSRDHGLTSRLRVVPADLDEDWPDLGPADLIWAASSLHEVADPARVLRAVHDALRPGGVAMILEMGALPSLLPDDVGSGRPGLEARCHAALATAGWNAYPDWAPALQAAGLDVVEQRRFPVEVGPGNPQAEVYARAWLGHQRTFLADALAAEDVATLDRLLADQGPDALLSSTRLTIRGSRIAWLARRP